MPQDTRILAAPNPRPSHRGQLFAHFIHSFCPDKPRIPDEAARSHHYWVQMLPDLGDTSTVLETSMAALAASYLGRMRDDRQLQTHALFLYGETVRSLSEAMISPAFIADDHTLAAIMCLGMSEVGTDPTGKGVQGTTLMFVVLDVLSNSRP